MTYLKIGWLVVMTAVLAYVVVPPIPAGGDERGIFFAYAVMFLTFPVGLVLYSSMELCARLLGAAPVAVWSNKAALSALWTLFVLAGYAQWFIACPRLWRLMFHRGLQNHSSKFL